MTIGDHPFLGVTIVGSIVSTVAFILLSVLLYRGWRTKTMRGYTLIYLSLLNMTVVWAC